MDEKTQLKLLKKDWYVQAGNLTPFYLISAGDSGFIDLKKFGLDYEAFIYTFVHEKGQMLYSEESIEKIYKTINEKLEKNPLYLKKLRAHYNTAQKKHHSFFKKLEKTDLKRKSLKELYALAKKTAEGVRVAVGIAHLIEAYSLSAEKHLKEEMKALEGKTKDLNQLFVEYTTPKEVSVFSKAHDALYKIAKNNPTDAKLKAYIRKYFWTRNSYHGRHPLTLEALWDEIRVLKNQDEKKSQPASEKTKVKLPPDLLMRLKTVAFVTDWQDKRKINILIAIEYAGRVLEEISKRIGIPHSLLRYALKNEFKNGMENMKKELAMRREGSIFISLPKNTFIATGGLYHSYLKILEKAHTQEVNDLRGTAASLGTATGKVKICTTMESISEVKEGDILVASMTRPEYLPAMRRAAAFVTDEGGVTCHAAIVAREMGKPCVIGTRIATRVLKDGDVVEVKGNHGTVIIREKVA